MATTPQIPLQYRDWAEQLAGMTDAELATTTRDFIWLAEKQESLVGRRTFTSRRDLCVAECERRGRRDFIDQARA